MKKLFLLILFFSSISFAQLVKPGGGATKDSLTYTLPKTNGNSFLSPSFYAKNNNIIYSNVLGSIPTSLFYLDTYSNLSIGYNNLTNVTSANTYNSAFGQACLQNLNNGSFNSAYGGGTLGAETNISYSSAFGDGAGGNNIAGIHLPYACLFGYNSAYRSSGNHLISIGINSFGSSSGNFDLIIGDAAAFSSTFDSSIVLGVNAAYQFGAYGGTHSSNIIIGNGAGYNVAGVFGNEIGNIYIGTNQGYNQYYDNGILRIGNNNNFIVGQMNTGNLFLKANLNIDSVGMTLKYHTIIGSTNRTAGIDSLTSGVDTVRTTAYDANSLVFITDLSAAGTPGHQYIDKINSVPGSYFIVLSKSALDNSLFNWFILKTY